jgi:hypothetical protein
MRGGLNGAAIGTGLGIVGLSAMALAQRRKNKSNQHK